MNFTRDHLLKVLHKVADRIIANKQFLTDLDAAIGDGDHGINMAKGFNAVKTKLAGVEDKDCGNILKTVAMTLISTVGGASGPLYGTAFLKASAVVNGKMEISKEDSLKMLEAAIEGIISRGKAKKGDKTMLDTLVPVLEVLTEGIKNGDDKAKLLNDVVETAASGVEYTKSIIALKGRASYLGERSLGHQDPGATSSYLMLKEVAEFILEEASDESGQKGGNVG